MIKKSPLPIDVIEDWPEVLRDIEVNVIPLYYVNQLSIIFNNDDVISMSVPNNSLENIVLFEIEFYKLLDQHSDDISYIDFQLNVKRLKRDISKKTKKFLKL